MDKFGYTEMDAFLNLIFSETYRMLKNVECGKYGLGDIFDMWIAEKITGNPRNVDFLRMGENNE